MGSEAVNSDDMELFIDLAADTELHVAGMTRDDRAMTVFSMIRAANIAYAVWREGRCLSFATAAMCRADRRR